MGYGLGACIGAQIGQPDKVCINIAGDGCFRMNMNELATASRYNIPTAIRVTKKEEVAPAIEKAIALKAPVMIECMIPEDDKVFPMVPAGAPISEVFDGDDLKRQS